MAEKPLTGVVALVSFRTDSAFNFKQTISTKLTNLGAKVTKRFGKDVTHIVFQKRLQPSPEQLVAERADLRALHDRASKAQVPLHIVSLLWVERSASDNMRAMEQKYAVPRPSDEDLLGHKTLTPGSSGRKRSRRTMQPKDMKELEVDTTDAIFSSSQLIREQSKAGVDAGEVSSPAPQQQKPTRKAQQAVTKFVRYDGTHRPAKKQAQLQRDQQALDTNAAALPAAEPARGGNSITAALSRQRQRQGQAAIRSSQPRAGKQSAGTGMKRKREDPEAETGTDHRPQEPGSKSNITGPAVESKQQSLQKPCGKAAGKHLRSEPVQLCNLDKARPRSADAVKSATRRQSSRLAKATASPADITAPVESIAAVDTQHQQGMAAPNSHQQAGSSPRCDDTDMLDAAPAAGEAAVPDSPEHIADGHALQQEHGHSTQQQGAGLSGAMHQQDVGAALSTEQQLHVSKGVVDSLQGDSSLAAVPVLVPGGSSRFSARYLHQKVEAKLHISKATPLGLPPTPLLPAGQQASTIPIPDFSRVPSPWTTTLSDPSQPTPLPPTAALLPTSASEPEVPAASGSQPVSTARAVPAPPIWSAMRPWDPNPTRHPTESSEVPPPAPVAEASHQQPLAEHNPDVGRVPKQANCKPRQHEGRQGCNQDRQLNVAEEQAAGDQEMPEACGTQQEEEASPSAGPPTGGLSLSCVDGAVHEVARNAVRSLRGVRLCSEGHEEGRLTHLVLGQSRRTLKVLLAIAAGAILVTPDWLTASLEAGEWLPEEPFLAKGRFAEAALTARGGPDHAKPEPLLHGRKVYVHVAEAARKGASSGNGSALRRLVAALGGKAAGAKSCDLCIISGGGPRPSSLNAKTLAVKEEWLLKGTEQYRLESTRLYAVT